MKKTLIVSAVMALTVSITTMGIGYKLIDSKPVEIRHISTQGDHTLFTKNEKGDITPLDFTGVAENVVDAVVHIQSTQIVNNNANPSIRRYRELPDPFRDFFGDDSFRRFFQYPDRYDNGRNPSEPRTIRGSGSGVIINDQGYIVTNNHVINEADEIQVTLHDNRTYKATVIGTDPATDLALLQIKEKNLPTLPLINSDDVKVGEWVLAVGNPFSLNSTVTAGIVSAKARNINILRQKFAVESFIQTDAAINPGNSGGALVNLQGGLIGINTAIQSNTGSYSGYGFAIPSNIVNKVVEDLLKYGVVQRGVLGVMIRSVTGQLAEEKDLELTTGVYVDSLLENSAAADAGIQPGDVIRKVNGMTVNTSPELQELIARHRPGDQIDIDIIRDGMDKTFHVTLYDTNGKSELARKEYKEVLSVLGIEAQSIDTKTADKLDIAGGIRITKLYPGKLRKQTQVREGFIVTHIDGRKVTVIEEFVNILEEKRGGVMLEGIYEDIPGIYYYAFGMNS